jgi:hypothetical protein
MQYLHDNLKMHTICGGKVQYPHYDHNAHYIRVAKCNIGIMTLNPHYLWEAKMLNPYIKHGTFLVEFDDRIKTI